MRGAGRLGHGPVQRGPGSLEDMTWFTLARDGQAIFSLSRNPCCIASKGKGGHLEVE